MESKNPSSRVLCNRYSARLRTLYARGEPAYWKIMGPSHVSHRSAIRDVIHYRLVLLFAIATCVFAAGSGYGGASEQQRTERLAVADHDLAAAQALMDQIASLSPRVRRDEAARVATCVYNAAVQLRRDYGVIWPPLFNNLLINSGIKKRGLCFQWAEDLLVRLDTLKLTTLDLRWGEGYAGTWQESNCVVVTAKGQPFNTGIILDCWRHSGHLYWTAVASDKVPWVENKAFAHFVRAKSASKALGANRRRDNARS
jgi:hypothetical protein